MKIIVTHTSPDMDAITSVWLIRRFLQGWEDAQIQFVPAGERIGNIKYQISKIKNTIERIGGDEVIHVDTGLGPLDHHQTASDKVCAASLTWEYVKNQKFNPSTSGRTVWCIPSLRVKSQKSQKEKDREEAVSRMVKVVVDTDHFKEVFWEDATSDYHEFSVGAVLDGLKLAKPNRDEYYVDFISECLDAILHEFENRIWAEREIRERGIEFTTRFGKGMGFETINDSVLKLAQKMGYVVVVRKDPRKGYVRVKARPSQYQISNIKNQKGDEIDLTLAYEKLRKMDPTATWFLHIGKKMLLNGSVKNPKMRPTRLGLGEIIKVLEKI